MKTVGINISFLIGGIAMGLAFALLTLMNLTPAATVAPAATTAQAPQAERILTSDPLALGEGELLVSATVIGGVGVLPLLQILVASVNEEGKPDFSRYELTAEECEAFPGGRIVVPTLAGHKFQVIVEGTWRKPSEIRLEAIE